MQPPSNTHDALQRMVDLLSAIMADIEAYTNNPSEYSPEYFSHVGTAAGDALLLAVWARDQLRGEQQCL